MIFKFRKCLVFILFNNFYLVYREIEVFFQEIMEEIDYMCLISYTFYFLDRSYSVRYMDMVNEISFKVFVWIVNLVYLLK